MDEIVKKIIDFRDEREWRQFHTPENLSKSIVLEAAELLENFQWDDEYDLENVKEELADILIYSISMCDILHLDYQEIIKDKIKKNAQKYPVSKSKGNSKKYNQS